MRKVSSYLQKRSIVGVTFVSLLSFLFVTAGVYGATTIDTSINTGGTLTVTGKSTLTGAIYASSTAQVNSTFTTYADTVFNEDGAATGDFRIEGDTKTSMFMVDASADRVGIGTSTPSAFFSVGEAGNTVTGDIYLTGGLTVGATSTINSAEGTILLSNAYQSDPTGVEGLFYYSAANKNVRLYNGSSWGVIGTSTGFDLSGRDIRLSDINNQFITLGTTTAHDASLLTLEATSTLSVPLTLVGETSQVANLFQVKNDADTNLFYVNSAGGVFGSSTAQFTGALTTYGSDKIGDAQADTLTINSGVIAMGNAATTTIQNSQISAWGIATSTSSVYPVLVVDTSKTDQVARIGIGTFTPATTLDVSGAFTVSGTSTLTTGTNIGGGYAARYHKQSRDASDERQLRNKWLRNHHRSVWKHSNTGYAYRDRKCLCNEQCVRNGHGAGHG
ncbi:MAG: hypothetical protein HYU35_03215 [Parcubacteria group bacterium]|nr:hypothetical protein [Parcubacteria group bacterium]